MAHFGFGGLIALTMILPSRETVSSCVITILLVEDSLSDAMLLRRLLNGPVSRQYEIVHYRSMAEAQEYLAMYGVDIVLLDLGLPDASGLEALEQMLGAQPLLPVVVLTGRYDDDQLAVNALRAGAQDFLVKGEIDETTLMRAMRYGIERKSMEEKLFLEKERAHVTLKSIGDAVVCTDNFGQITFLNRSAEKMAGLSYEEALGKHIGMVVCLTSDQDGFFKFLPNVGPNGTEADVSLPLNATLIQQSGDKIPVEGVGTRILGRNAEAIGAVYVLRDMTAFRATALKMAHMAHHDSLTGLPNRALLTDRINNAIASASRRKERPSILFLDLDGFKHVNDSLGHTIGDKLLQSVAKRLSECVRESDTVSRLGGDEFVVLLPEITHPDDAVVAAQRMLDAVSESHIIDNQEMHITTSIGISLYPNDGTDAETLIKNADTAMYQVKESGRENYRYFEPSMNARAVERRLIEQGLRRAVERKELSLHYQPRVKLASKRIHGAEVLIRWSHPELGQVPPSKFIAVAEDCRLIVPLGRWILREACQQAKAWRDVGFDLPILAVNISATEIQNEHFLQSVFDTLDITGMKPSQLELELTETVLMQHNESALSTLKALSGEGVRLAIDDFGTGFSNLSYLTQFPVNTLKIDQSFIRQITEAPPQKSIVTAVLSMAHSLSLQVVAEGVEKLDEVRFLEQQNCDEAQGYYFSRPLPAQKFEEWHRIRQIL